MEITEIRIKLATNYEDRLRAFCSITFDGEFVIRDLKVIEGQNTSYFVAMPSRKLMEKCHACSCKNDVGANFCNSCGVKLHKPRPNGVSHGSGGERNKKFADIAHPINSECRKRIELAVRQAYEAEKERAKDPNYVCRYDDIYASEPVS